MMRWLAMALVLGVASCGEPPRAPDPPASGACDVATPARQLVSAGHLERARRVLGEARGACPEQAHRQWALELEVLAELGRWRDLAALEKVVRASPYAGEAPIALALRRAGELMRAHLARPHAGAAAWRTLLQTSRRARAARQRGELAGARELFEKAWSLWRPHGRSLIEAGLVALEQGDVTGAQRLFDRGLAELEASSGAAVSLDTRPGIADGVHVESVHGHTLDALGQKSTVLSVLDRTTGAETFRLPTTHHGASSPDERWLVTVDLDHVTVWDAAAGRASFTFDGPCYAPRFSPDGAQLACNDGERIALYDTATGEALRALGPGERFFFTQDGATLVVVPDDARIELWSTALGTKRGELATVGTSHVAAELSPDGRLLATSRADDPRVQLFDVLTGKEVAQLDAHPSEAWALAFSPDGERLASASHGQTLEWDVSAAALLHELPSCEQPLAYSPDGGALACGGLSVWNTKTCTREAGEHAWGGSLHTLAYTTSGDHLLTHWRELQRGSVEIRDAQSLAVVGAGLSSETASFSQLLHSPDGVMLAAVRVGDTSSVVWRWDLRRGAQLAPIAVTGRVEELRFSHGGEWIGARSLDGQVRVLDAHTGAAVAAFPSADTIFGAFAFTADDSELSVMNRQGAIDTWNIAAARLETTVHVGAPRVLSSPLLSGDAKKLYSLTSTALEVRDASSSTLLARHPMSGGSLLAESPDGGHVVVSQSSRAHIVAVADGASTPVAPPRGSDPRVSSVAFSADGKWLAVGGHWDGAFASNRDTGGWQGPFLGENDEDGVASLAFAGNERLSVSFESGMLRMWRIADGELLATVQPVAGRDAAIVIGRREDGSPAVDVMGRAPLAAEAAMHCRVGPHVLPFAACRSRFWVPGLFAKLFRGETIGVLDVAVVPPPSAKARPASPSSPPAALEPMRCRPANDVVAWWNAQKPSDRSSGDEDVVWPRLTPAETKAQVKPVADEVVRHLWSRDYAALAKLVHPRGLRLENAHTLSRARVAAIAQDRRRYRFDDDHCGASSLYSLASVFDDRIHGRPHNGGRNYSTPRLVGHSRIAPFGINFSFTTASVSRDYAGLPFVHFAVSAREYELGHRAGLVLVFDEHRGSYALVALFGVDEDLCG